MNIDKEEFQSKEETMTDKEETIEEEKVFFIE